MRNLPKFIFSLNFLYIVTIAVQATAIIFLCFYIPSFLPSAIVYAAIWIVTAAAATALFARGGAPEAKCAWFVLITALPIAGAVIYLLATVKRKPCGLLKFKTPDGKSCCGACVAGYDRAEYFDCGSKFFDAVFEEISKARKSVYLEFFIISRGAVFERLTEALNSAARNGAEIKIIYDGIGSAFRIGKKQIKRLEKLGAEVKIFHRLTPFPRARLNFRDHRKIISVDGKAAFTGGINIADEYANIDSPHGYWKDSGVGVYGAAAKALEAMFLSVWFKSFETELPSGGNFSCMPFYDSPPYRAFCEDAYVCALNRAAERIHILTPYFCTGEKTAAALRFAALRGVDVKIIIPHIPDKKYAFEISKAYAKPLAEAGVKFYEYTPGFMHGKCLICDGDVYLGSYNFDFRSMHYNFECGIKFDGRMTGLAEKDFDACLKLSSPLDEKRISAPRRFCRFLLKLFSPLI